MSLYGMMRTGVSGMQGQASKLSTIADNIANANTSGYKRFGIQFSTLVVNGATDNYNSGGVVTSVRQAVTQQGVLQYSNSTSDLAIDGNGFFVVQDGDGNSFLTRAGSFVPDAQGQLVNAAGFYLAGYSYATGDPSVVVNGFEGLEPVTIISGEIDAAPSTEAVFAANLPASADAVTGSLPSSNAAGAEYTQKSSMVVYDNLGGQVILDIYYTKTGANTWEVTVYDQADAAPDTSFPYSSGSLASDTIAFDSVTGDITGATTSVSVAVPNGGTLNIDLSDMTQLSTDFLVSDIIVDGNAPASIDRVEFSSDGIVFAQYTDGSTQALFRVPVANVNSPDELTSLSGNVFQASEDSGEVRLGFAGQGGYGQIISGAVETSNVDIAEELTEMIQSQRNYTANSKVFQTGSDLMDVLLNLKR